MDLKGATRAQILSKPFKSRETNSTTKPETKLKENFIAWILRP